MRNALCDNCGESFEPKRKSQRFCSRTCSGLATARKRGQQGRQDFECEQCGKHFEDYATNRTNDRAYCSPGCATAARRVDRPACEVCGEPVRLLRNRYCSKRCSNAARPNPGFTSWSGFYARAQRANPDPEPCAHCGGSAVHRHHPDYNDPERVVWLCGGCHNREHDGKRHGKRFRPEVPLPK